MIELSANLPLDIKITDEDLKNIPHSVLALISYLLEENARLKKQIEELKAKLNMNSSNSSKPPSSDNPLLKEKATSSKKKTKTRRRRKGYRQEMLPPDTVKSLVPGPCACGNSRFSEIEPYYTHQVIELPKIQREVTHFVLHRGKCPCCGKMNKALVPAKYRSGFGPKLSAMIAEMAGTQADSRRIVQNFCASVLDFHISLGAIQKVLDRVSKAIEPHYEAIAEAARSAPVNHVDETSWRRNGALSWLWVMGNAAVALFMIHSRRSKKAFESLVKDWNGILVSDGYGVYRKWVGQRQSCLAHLIRQAKGLSECKDPEIAKFGAWTREELRRLCRMAKAPPTVGEWNMFYARFIRLITLYGDRKDEAGKFARRLRKEMESLWLFLQEKSVAATNNHAERLLRFAVIWRKSSFGTVSEKGDRWVERILSLRQTCRIRGVRTYPVLVDAVRSFFRDKHPDLAWINELPN